MLTAFPSAYSSLPLRYYYRESFSERGGWSLKYEHRFHPLATPPATNNCGGANGVPLIKFAAQLINNPSFTSATFWAKCRFFIFCLGANWILLNRTTEWFNWNINGSYGICIWIYTFFFAGSISNIDGAEYHCNKTQVRKVISGVVGAASSVTSIQVANLLRLFKIPQVRHCFVFSKRVPWELEKENENTAN